MSGPPPTPAPSTFQKYLHACIVGFVTGLASTVASALTTGLTSQAAWKAAALALLVGGVSRAAGAFLVAYSKDNPT